GDRGGAARQREERRFDGGARKPPLANRLDEQRQRIDRVDVALVDDLRVRALAIDQLQQRSLAGVQAIPRQGFATRSEQGWNRREGRGELAETLPLRQVFEQAVDARHE